MKLLIKERGTCKTTGLIYASEATGCPIVTSSKINACYIIDNAKQMGCDIPDPITVDDLRFHKMEHVTHVLFDNVETILEKAINEYLGTNVVCATMTAIGDKNKENKEELND